MGNKLPEIFFNLMRSRFFSIKSFDTRSPSGMTGLKILQQLRGDKTNSESSEQNEKTHYNAISSLF